MTTAPGGIKHMREVEARTIAARREASGDSHDALHAASLDLAAAFTKGKAARLKAIAAAEHAIAYAEAEA